MDGEFACPECGEDVVVRSTGPGRQVRCAFCNTLVEVPFLPRVQGEWRRRRFGRPWWWAWAWWGIGLSVLALVAVAAVLAVIRGERAAHIRSIGRLVESSRSHEAAGRLDLAMLDLDTAIQSARSSDDFPEAPDAIRERRRDLARRDVQDVLEKLGADDRGADSLGDWLNLVARAGADRDLAPIRKDVEARFNAALRSWLNDLAVRASREDSPETAVGLCKGGADLAVHLPPVDRDAAVGRFRAIVAGLVERRGVAIHAAPGQYVRGTSVGYDKALHDQIVETLGAKGYLPPSSSRWVDLWSKAPYQFSYTIRESHEGTYLGTQNRLTRIDAALVLSGPSGETWKTSPNARTVVPVPGMPSYLASRLALGADRVDEAERLLYEDAFSRIREKFRGGLASLPACPAGVVVGSVPR